MAHFFNFLKINYTYIVYAIEALFAFISILVALFKSRRVRSLKSENCSFLNTTIDVCQKYQFLLLLPSWISQANTLYPCHGDGLRRFEFVYQKALGLFDEEPSDDIRMFVSEAVDSVLNADKFEKIYTPVDTQGFDFEPKKEFFYETKKDAAVERPESLRQDREEDKSAQCSARYVSRRD